MDNQRENQYVPAPEGKYPRVELEGVQSYMGRDKRLENAQAFVDMPTQHGYMLHAAPVKETVSFLIAEIERLQTALHTHQSYDKSAAELYAEVSQLREERDSLKREFVALRKSLDQRESEAYKRWKTEGDLHKQGMAAGLDVACDLVSEVCRALGIGGATSDISK